MRATIFLISAAWSFSALAGEVSGVGFELPGQRSWVQVTSQDSEAGYLKEWVPEGSDVQTTDWIIVSQKLPLGKRTSAKKLLKTMMNLSRQTCTDVLFNGPEKIVTNKEKTYWGKIMCAQVVGKDYGAFIDQRVIVEGKDAWVVTSELRTEPTSVAGQLEFGRDAALAKKSIEEFMVKLSASARFTREGIDICLEQGC
jgi:hypothetical protein